jgi:hypothetical protein
VLLDLNSNAKVASATQAGNSAATPEGRAALEGAEVGGGQERGGEEGVQRGVRSTLVELTCGRPALPVDRALTGLL